MTPSTVPRHTIRAFSESSVSGHMRRVLLMVAFRYAGFMAPAGRERCHYAYWQRWLACELTGIH